MYRLAQLYLPPTKNAKTLSDIFVAEPDNLKKSIAGQLFVLIQINNKNKESIKIIEFLINNLNKNYYQNEKLLLKDRIEFLSIEHIFESSLAKSNKDFSEFIKKDKIKINLSDINIMVGVIHNERIYISNHGSNQALLLYKKDEEYKISNIAQDDDNSKSKLFSNVINGKIPKSSHFIFCNETLPEYISSSQLIKIITTLPPSSATEQIKQLLLNINQMVPFLALIYKNSLQEKELSTEEESKQDSIVTLNKSEDRTEELLSPGGLISFKKFFSIFKKKTKSSSKPKIGIKDKIIVKRKSFLRIFWKKTKSIILLPIALFLNLLQLSLNFLKSKTKLNDIKILLKNALNLISSAIKKPFLVLNFKHKILLALLFLVVVLFFLNINKTKEEKVQNLEEENYQKIVNELEQKESQVEAKLLYSNENGAKKLFEEIQKLLKEMPQNTPEQKNKYQEFKEKFAKQLEKAWRVKRVNLEKIADFSEIKNDINLKSFIFNPQRNRIYLGDSSDNTIYVLNLKDKLITSFADFKKDLKSLDFPMLSKDNKIYFFNNNEIISYNPPKAMVDYFDILLVGDYEDIKDAKAYSGKIYTLNKKEGQIYKYVLRGGKFKPLAWFKNKKDFSQAQSISIDGYIYILFKNGQIEKYLRGEKKDFSLEQVEPSLNRANSLIVSPENDYIYILDKENSRIIVFDKDGEFILQYKNDKIQNAKDFDIDEKNSKIYILNKNSIYDFNLEHIKTPSN